MNSDNKIDRTQFQITTLGLAVVIALLTLVTMFPDPHTDGRIKHLEQQIKQCQMKP